MTDIANKLKHIQEHMDEITSSLEQSMMISTGFSEGIQAAKTNAKRTYLKKKLEKNNKSLYDGLLMLRQYEALTEVYTKKLAEEQAVDAPTQEVAQNDV